MAGNWLQIYRNRGGTGRAQAIHCGRRLRIDNAGPQPVRHEKNHIVQLSVGARRTGRTQGGD